MSIHSRARDRPWGWSEGQGWRGFLNGSDQVGPVECNECLGRTSEKEGGSETGGMQTAAEGSVGRGVEKKRGLLFCMSLFFYVCLFFTGNLFLLVLQKSPISWRFYKIWSFIIDSLRNTALCHHIIYQPIKKWRQIAPMNLTNTTLVRFYHL